MNIKIFETTTQTQHLNQPSTETKKLRLASSLCVFFWVRCDLFWRIFLVSPSLKPGKIGQIPKGPSRIFMTWPMGKIHRNYAQVMQPSKMAWENQRANWLLVSRMNHPPWKTWHRFWFLDLRILDLLGEKKYSIPQTVVRWWGITWDRILTTETQQKLVWWLNHQPIWKNMRGRHIGSWIPEFRGQNFKKYLKPPSRLK